MAYIKKTLQTPAATTGTTYQATLPVHASGDLITVCLTQDTGTTEISLGSATVTITNASPAVFTYTGADIFADGDRIVLTTTGGLPTGLSASTTNKYYIKNINTTANTFEVSATSGGASINTSSAGSGTHTAHIHESVSLGWNMLGFQALSGAFRQAWAWKLATSASETNPTFTGTNSVWVAQTITWGDAHATAPFGTSPTSGTDFIRTDFTTNSTQTAGQITPAVDDCTIVYSWGVDCPGAAVYAKTKLNDAWCVDKYQSVTQLSVIAVKQQYTAALTDAIVLYETIANEGGNGWVFAIRNKSGGTRQPDIRASVNELKYYGSFGNLHDGTVTWQSPSNFNSGGSINSISLSTVAPTVTQSAVLGATENWGTYTQVASTENVDVTYGATGAWVGGTHTISSTNMSGKVVALQWLTGNSSTTSVQGSEGIIIAFGSSATNWVAYQIGKKSQGWRGATDLASFIATGVATVYASSGTIDWTAITQVGFFKHRITTATASDYFAIKNLTVIDKSAVVSGGANRPSTFIDFQKALVSWGGLDWAQLQASSQVMAKSSVQVGDGTNTTYFDASASSIEFPTAFDTSDSGTLKWNASSSAVGVYVKAKSTDTINLTAGVMATITNQLLTIDAASDTGATYSFSGMTAVGFSPTWKTGVPCNAMTFSSCGTVDFKAADIDQVVIKNSTGTACCLAENGWSATDSTFVSSTTAVYGVRIAAAGTYTISGCTFSGFTKDFDVTATTGTVTIVKDASDPTPTYQTAGATVVISSPTVERGLEFTGLVAGSKVKVFSTGTDTELFSTASSSTTETWDDATGGSITVDYVIMKAGYIPIRVTGIVVTGAVGTGVVTTPIQQIVDRAYVASSGLTINTNVFGNSTTKRFGLTTTSTLQNFYSYMIEQWIALGDSGEEFANVTFPLVSNGPNSFTFHEWEWDTTTYPNSITNLSRDGMRYVDASDVVLATWSAILTAGVSSGMRVRFQQVEGTTQSAAVTSGNMDELIQVYGDATHGNFNRTGYLVCKVQEAGYDQSEVDVVVQYGTLEDQLYVVALSPTANGVATGDPALTITVTDHGASPVTWNGKVFSVTITDNATPSSGTDIMRELRHNFEAGGTYQGKDGFNWHDLVQTNGADFKTVRGIIYGDTGATLKGVRVVQNDGTTAHPDFTLFTADDGTTYAPPTTVVVTLTGFVSGTRIQIYDTANSVELFNDIVAATSKVYTETYSVDRTIRVRASYVSGTSAKAFVEANLGSVTSSAPTVSRDLEQVNDTVYNTNAINGSSVTGITFTDSAIDTVNINISAGSTTWQDIYAAFAYWMFTATGIADDIAYVQAVDPANYQLTSMLIKNTSSPTVPLQITGGYGVDSTTLASIDLVDTTGGTLVFAPDHVVSKVVTVGGVNVITGDIADVPTAAEIRQEMDSNSTKLAEINENAEMAATK